MTQMEVDGFPESLAASIAASLPFDPLHFGVDGL